MKRTLLPVFCIVILAGCASAGNQKLADQNKQSIDQKIVVGKTTKADIKNSFGEPTSISFTDAGNEIDTYSYSHASPKARNFIPFVGLFAGGADVNSKTLVIMFDKNDAVSKYTMNEVASETKAGIGQ